MDPQVWTAVPATVPRRLNAPDPKVGAVGRKPARTWDSFVNGFGAGRSGVVAHFFDGRRPRARWGGRGAPLPRSALAAGYSLRIEEQAWAGQLGSAGSRFPTRWPPPPAQETLESDSAAQVGYPFGGGGWIRSHQLRRRQAVVRERTESVAEKMLTNWFTFLLYKFLKVNLLPLN
ncbi:hypothetical protein CRUP_029815 [Coryphaenoides rupestris]|nr:hypothetical protein CRUP_029815 [Coryphaenoides rupestris]